MVEDLIHGPQIRVQSVFHFRCEQFTVSIFVREDEKHNTHLRQQFEAEYRA
jgi:hypothetical protein